MKYQLVVAIFCLLGSTYVSKLVDAVIVSPCTVRNLVAQPEYGTSLRTRALVTIIQIPPVFVQNVMVGICENQNQNVSTGNAGEFYSCQQRYSAVEVYIADASVYGPSNPGSYQKPYPTDNLNNIQFARESVIIESGCDFTFNLLPLIANAQQQQMRQQPPNVPPEQKMFLKSPYHPVFRQPPMSAVPVPAPPPPQGVPVMEPVPVSNPGSVPPPAQGSPVTYSPAPTVTYATQGRANLQSEGVLGNAEQEVSNLETHDELDPAA